MANEAKIIRGQVRQVVKEVMGEILTQELVAAMQRHIQAQVSVLDKDVRDSMGTLNKRYEELASYIVRHLQAGTTTTVEPSALSPDSAPIETL